MKKVITTILIICIAVGVLSAARINPFSTIFSPNGNQDRDRTWKLANRIIDSWDGSAWAQSEKTEYYYNANYTTRVDSIYTFGWESTASMWIPQFKLSYTYLPNQEYIGLAEYTMMIAGMNIPFVRIYATYDTQNRLTEYYMTMYDMQTSQWGQMIRMKIIYGTGTTFQVYQWQAGDEEDPAAYGKGDFAYDGQGRIITETWQTSPDSTNWVNDNQTTRTYHAHDNTTGAQFIYNIAHQMVFSAMEDNNSVTTFGMVAEETEKNWVSGAWVNSEKANYTYNAADKLTNTTIQYWDSSAWANSERYDYTYDTNNNTQTMIYQTFSAPSTWNNESRTTYNWTQSTDNDDNVSPAVNALALKVYPNPFRDTMTISAKSNSDEAIVCSIYNLKGQMVRSMSISRDASITWDGLDNLGNAQGTGIYFIKAVQGNSTATHKFLKLK